LSLHTPHPPRLTLFPYTTLFRSKELGGLHSQSLVLQFFGSPVRDAQPQPKRPVGRNLSLDCRARPFNRLPVIRPAHARMHVQAIGQVNPRIVREDHDSCSPRCRTISIARSIIGQSASPTSCLAPIDRGEVTVSSPPRCSRKSSIPRKLSRAPSASRRSNSGCHSVNPHASRPERIHSVSSSLSHPRSRA